MPSHSGCGRSWTTSFQPMCGIFRPAFATAEENFGTRPGSRPKPGVSPSSPCSNSICSPMQMPRKGLLAAAEITASRAPLAASWRMQSGIAPWPGTTTRSAARIASRSEVTSTSASGGTRSSAFGQARQCLRGRCGGGAEAADAAFVADRLDERLADGDGDVLDRVVRVDVEVALGLDLEIEHAVARDLVEHVLQEGNARGQFGHALA